MPTARDSLKLAWFQNRIWAIGGWGGGPSTKVESYDPVSNAWQTEASLTVARIAPYQWVSNGKLYVGGGATSLTDIHSSIECYDPILASWQIVGDLPEKKHQAGAALLDGKVYVVAGRNESNFTDKVFAADVSPPMDLYYREANASGTITLDKLSTELADEFANSTAVSVPVGLVTAVDYNDENPSDHTILERTTATPLTVEEMAPKCSKICHDG